MANSARYAGLWAANGIFLIPDRVRLIGFRMRTPLTRSPRVALPIAISPQARTLVFIETIRSGDPINVYRDERFRVAKGSEAAFEQVWLSRDSHLDKVPTL